MSHKLHEEYKAQYPVPKIALKSLIDPSGATETKAKHLRGRDKKEEQERNETEKSTSRMQKGKEVLVKDPVTGEETTVKHGGEEGDEADARNKGENVLDMDYPPPNWETHRAYVLDLTRSAIAKIMVAYVVSPFVIYFISGLPLIWRLHCQSQLYVGLGGLVIIPLIPPSLLAYTLLFALHKKAAEDFDDRVWDAERARGLVAGEDQDGDDIIGTHRRINESAEWLNTILRGIWPIINPDMFNSAIDTLEDIMQASSPKFTHSVRIADLGQGSNPLRITSVRSLPEMETDEALKGIDDATKENLNREHVNVEVSFAYRALPSGSTASSKAHNAHLLIEFFLGIGGTYEFSFPVWVELTGVSGTARARLELIPNPPFIKTTLVTLMGLPRVSISVVPMSKSLPNFMNIPVLSSFISKSIETACAEYVAPRCLTLDLQQLISGDDIKKDTKSTGVIVVHIHRAKDLKKMDSRNSSDTESSDPYVTVVYSRQGKPLYSTRIIFADLNPCFEETAVVTVDANAIKIREKLNLQLWDSDRASADDMMGYVEIDILELMRNKNTPSRRVCSLISPDSERRIGHLEFTAGYYEKMRPDGRLKTDGSDPAISEDLKKNDPEFQEARAVTLNDLEASVLRIPPSSEWPSGILSVQVHEIRDLKIRMEGRETSVFGGRRSEGVKGQCDNGEEQEEGSNLPSSYCTIVLNDTLVYTSRVKPITSTPIFNAGTERFVRDWRCAHVSVTVRDSRMRENDPILGIVYLKLSDVLVNASEVSRFFAIENGIGYGSARISVLFRPAQVKLPPNLLGFDVGTLAIRKLCAKPIGENAEGRLSALQSCGVNLKLPTCSNKISKKHAELQEGGSVVWKEDRPTEMPVQQRYGSALVFEFKESGALKTSKLGIAVLWLRDVVDNEDNAIDIALFKAENYDRLRQNYVPPDGNPDSWETSRGDLVRIGTVQLDLTFNPGIGTAHRKTMNTSEPQQKRLLEDVGRRDSESLQGAVGNYEDGKAVSGQNTEVSQGEARVEAKDDDEQTYGANGHHKYTNESEADGSADDDDDPSEEKGLMHKLKEWKKHEKKPHQQHRGIMQNKPARTAEWLKDSVEETSQKVKNRFKMKSRQPDVETEV